MIVLGLPSPGCPPRASTTPVPQRMEKPTERLPSLGVKAVGLDRQVHGVVLRSLSDHQGLRLEEQDATAGTRRLAFGTSR